MEPHVAFGQVLKKYRLEKGLSQERLALESGLDRTYISLLERGKRQPSIKTLFAISAHLKIRPSTLIEKTEDLVSNNL